MEQVVEQVLAAVRHRLAEQLTLDDLAEIAMFSKFHFARMFRRVTGVSPRRFLYALRLQEAKRLLVTTPLSVADVSYQVGYSSVGTFTSRFTASVGVPPAVYRRLRGKVSSVLRGEPPDPAVAGAITGRLEGPAEGPANGAADGPVLVGLFRHAVPEGRPTRCDVLGRTGEWSFQHVPAGRWYVLAVAVRPAGAESAPATEHQATMMSMHGPVKVGPESPTAHVTVRLRPVRPTDPPILVPLAGAVTSARSGPGCRPPACVARPSPGDNRSGGTVAQLSG